MEEKHTQNWIAVIPAKILYDRNISATSKLLYAVVSNLTNKLGYCWATNDYLASQLDTTNKTIQRSIKQLSDAGHIISQVERNKDGTKRRITLTIAGGTILSNEGGTILSIGSDKKVQHNTITDNNNLDINYQDIADNLLKWINKQFTRSFRILETRQLKARLKVYTIEEIQTAIKNAYSDDYHKQTDFKYLTPEYFLRNDKNIDKWLNKINNGKKTTSKQGKQNRTEWLGNIGNELGLTDQAHT